MPSKPKLQTKILAQHSTEGNSPQFNKDYEDYDMVRGLWYGTRITMWFEDYGLRFTCTHKDYTKDYEDYTEDYGDYEDYNPHNPQCNPRNPGGNSQQEK